MRAPLNLQPSPCKRLLSSGLLAATVAASTAALSPISHAQQIKPAPLNYTVLASRFFMPGMEEVENSMLGGMMQGMMGGEQSPGGFGIGKNLELRITHRTAQVPSALHNAVAANTQFELLPSGRGSAKPEGEPDFPQFKINFYWGCGTAVRQGQPRVIDSTRMSAAEMGRQMPYARGGQVQRCGSGQTCWPHAKENRVKPPASILGDHSITAPNQPNIRFNLTQDYLEGMRISGQGSITSGLAMSWQQVPNAQAYYLMGVESNDGAKEMTIWTSSEIADAGSASMSFLTQGTIAQWVRSKLLLPSSQAQCSVPAGIFKSKDAMILATAFGPEVTFIHPPRPADAKAPWNQEWAATVRYSSFAMYNEQMAEGASSQGRQQGRETDKPKEAASPVESILKGIFGR